MINAFLALNKNVGATSHDAVNKARRVYSQKKIGHAGTLDPFADGLLILALGAYTRLIPLFDDDEKRYIVRACFGEERDTDDVEGAVRKRAPIEGLSFALIEGCLKEHFSGEVEQVPPAYSAVKVKGKRAYAIARAGGELELKRRKITIYESKLLRYEAPYADIEFSVSRGTYIRSLVRDLARELDSAAYAHSLTRTAIGKLSIEQSVDVDKMSEESLLSFSDIFKGRMPEIVHSSQSVIRRLLNGNIYALADTPQGRCAHLNESGELLAISDKPIDGEASFFFVNGNVSV